MGQASSVSRPSAFCKEAEEFAATFVTDMNSHVNFSTLRPQELSLDAEQDLEQARSTSLGVPVINARDGLCNRDILGRSGNVAIHLQLYDKVRSLVHAIEFMATALPACSACL